MIRIDELWACRAELPSASPNHSTAFTQLLHALPMSAHRKRSAADAPGDLDGCVPRTVVSLAGRRRLRGPQDQTDIFADVTADTVNGRDDATSNLMSRFEAARRTGVDFASMVQMQLDVGDVVTVAGLGKTG